MTSEKLQQTHINMGEIVSNASLSIQNLQKMYDELWERRGKEKIITFRNVNDLCKNLPSFFKCYRSPIGKLYWDGFSYTRNINLYCICAISCLDIAKVHGEASSIRVTFLHDGVQFCYGYFIWLYLCGGIKFDYKLIRLSVMCLIFEIFCSLHCPAGCLVTPLDVSLSIIQTTRKL